VARAPYACRQAGDLTSTEFDLCGCSRATRQGAVAQRHPQQAAQPRLRRLGPSVDCRIYRLRRKLGDLADSAERIKTIRNVGYLFSPHTGRPTAAP
jgi:DNA-binding response OmpR family regulator